MSIPQPIFPNTRLSRAVLPVLAVGSVCLPGVTPAMALATGILAKTILGNPYGKQVGPWATKVQTAALVGLGAGMKLDKVIQAGVSGVGFTACSILGTLALGHALGKFLHGERIDKDQRFLLDVGTAICGGSAINAVAKAKGISPDDPKSSVAMGIVFALNGVGLYLFPEIGHQLHMLAHDFGVWVAFAAHDTSSVVGAAQVYDPDSVQTAVVLKSARAFWIMPLALWVSFLKSRQDSPHMVKLPTLSDIKISDIKMVCKKVWEVTPGFIPAFLGAALLVNYVPSIHSLGEIAFDSSKRAMVLMLFLVGTKMSVQDFAKVGLRPLAHGSLLWFIVGGLSLAAVQMGLVE